MAWQDRALARQLLSNARKALNQWLDAPDDRRSHALLVVGTPHGGTGALVAALHGCEQVWTWGADAAAAFDGEHLRPPDVVEALLWATPADAVVLEILGDVHLVDRVLEVHDGARAVWLVRPWREVAELAVAAQGDAALRAIQALADGTAEETGALGVRVPEAVVEQVRACRPADLSPAAGAALDWYVRTSFLYTLQLDTDPRVLVLPTPTVAADPVATLTRVLAHAGVSTRQPLPALDLAPSPPSPAVEVGGDVAALCDALWTRVVA
ncbi:MAG: hypothetical protein H6732_03720 [Alphaproteobacteria bacterium]|nr:hypothetical protein [Alphaproteobacteria bacterium]